MADDESRAPPTVGSRVPALTRSFADQLSFDRERFAYLTERRDKLQDTMRLGLVALNGGSLLGLFGILGASATAAGTLGFTADRAKWSAIAFVLGVALAGLAWWIETNRALEETGDAFVRVGTARMVVSSLASVETAANIKEFEERMREYHDAPLVEFNISHWALGAQAFAGAAWLAGVALPVAKLLGW